MPLPTLTWTEPVIRDFVTDDGAALATALRNALAADPNWRIPVDTTASGYAEIVPQDALNNDRVLLWWDSGTSIAADKTICGGFTASSAAPGVLYKRGAGTLAPADLATDPYGAGASTTGWGILCDGDQVTRLAVSTCAAGVAWAFWQGGSSAVEQIGLIGDLIDRGDDSSQGVLLTGGAATASGSWAALTSASGNTASAIPTTAGIASQPHGAYPHTGAVKNASTTAAWRASSLRTDGLSEGSRSMFLPILLCSGGIGSALPLGVLRQAAMGAPRQGAGSLTGAGGAVLARFLCPCDGAVTDSLCLFQS